MGSCPPDLCMRPGMEDDATQKVSHGSLQPQKSDGVTVNDAYEKTWEIPPSLPRV